MVLGLKAHLGADADSGSVHTVRGTAGNVNDVVQANSLLHGLERDVFADAGYQGAAERPDASASRQRCEAQGLVRASRVSVPGHQAQFSHVKGYRMLKKKTPQEEQGAVGHAVRAEPLWVVCGKLMGLQA